LQLPDFGAAWVASLTECYNSNLATLEAHSWLDLALFHQGMKHQLFGDPSMRLPRAPVQK
jgi:hypothetical protein